MSTNLATTNKSGLIARMADRFGVEPDKMLGTLKATIFKMEVSNEQMMMILIVAEQYNLNVFTREIFPFIDKSGGVVPVVSIDGWARIINERPQLNGIKFDYGPVNEKGIYEWMECSIYRKDRELPITIRETFKEVNRDTQPWKSHPNRMLRHKTLIQCARIAFGFAGIYDEDEAQRIIEKDVTPVEDKPRIAMPQPRIKVEPVGDIDSHPSVAGATTRTIQDVPLSDGERETIKKLMEQAALTDIDMVAALGMRTCDLMASDFDVAMDWIKDPMRASNA